MIVTRGGTLLLTLVAAATSIRPVTAQQVAAASVPAAVRQALQSRFAGIGPVEWKRKTDGNYEAEFKTRGAEVAAKFAPSGAWLESETEIGAITMPEPVRAAIVKTYRGYRIVETQRLDRAVTPRLLYEIHLAGNNEVIKAQLAPDGALFARSAKADAIAAQALTVAGTWRGTSLCVGTNPACHDENVVYRISPAPGDTTGFNMQGSRILEQREIDMGTLACTLDRPRTTLYCVIPQGRWEFQLRHDSLIGGLTLPDKTAARRVAARRVP